MIDKSDNKTTLKALIDIDDPEILITDAGTPIVDGKKIHIEAQAHQVTFISQPDKETQEFRYELDDLEPGEYSVTYAINDRVEARLNFKIHGDGKPLPKILAIRAGEAEDDEWYGKVAVALSPGQQIVNWGSPKKTDQEIHINLLIDNIGDEYPVPVEALPDDEIPKEIQKNSEGDYLLNGSPVRLVSHLYYFGRLTEGAYYFSVHSRGKLIENLPFEVRGVPPMMELVSQNISETKAHHRFKINYESLSGLNVDSVRSARVWVLGPNDFREQATHETFNTPDILPVTTAVGTYSITGPRGLWSETANGNYQIVVEAEKVLDSLGNAPNKSYLGDIKVEIQSQAQSGTE